MMIQVAGGAALLSLCVTWAAIPLLIPRAERWSLVDHPGGRKIHHRSTPMVGGAAMAIGILAGVLFLVGAERLGHFTASGESDLSLLASVLGGAVLLLVVGVVDDRKGLSATQKFAAQLVAILPLVFAHGFTLLPEWLPGWAASTASLIWLLAILNAFNLLDGLDGLMGSVALLCALAFSVLAWTWGVEDTLLILSTLVGALAGFLPWNLPRASTFAGDGGSLVVGYLLAAASLRVLGHGDMPDPSTPPYAVLVLLLILAIPLYDLCSVLWVRFRERRHLFVADTSHLAHRMVRRGLSHRQALALISGCTLVTTLAGLLLARVGLAAAPIVIVQCLAVVGLLAVMEGRGPLDR